MASSSRLDTARRQLRVARIGIAAVAAAGFALAAVAPRATHPATSTRSTSGTSAATSDQAAQSTRSFGFDSGSIVHVFTQPPSSTASTLPPSA